MDAFPESRKAMISCMIAELHYYVSPTKRNVIMEDEPEYALSGAHCGIGDDQT